MVDVLCINTATTTAAIIHQSSIMELVRVFFQKNRVCVEMLTEDNLPVFMPITSTMAPKYVRAITSSDIFKYWIRNVNRRQLSKTDIGYIMSMFRMEGMGVALVIMRLGNVVEEECPVCYESGKLSVFKPCGHDVCEDCDTIWYEQSIQNRGVGTCSICRREFLYHME